MRGKEIFTVCRLCLGENVELIDVFLSKGSILGCTPASAIMELLRIQVLKGDRYPQSVCMECVRKLEEFKLFKRLCENNKELLDRAYSVNLGFDGNEGAEVLCRNESSNGLPLDEELPIGDPLDVYGCGIKRDVEGGSDCNGLSSSTELVGFCDQVQMKTDCTDDMKTEEPDQVVTTPHTSAESVTSNEEIADVVGRVFCIGDDDSEVFLKEEEDVGIPIDPLHLEEDPIKLENAFKCSPTETIESAMGQIPSMKRECKDHAGTVESDQISLHSSAVEVKSDEGITECGKVINDSDGSHKEEVLDIPAESDSDGIFEDDIPQITGNELTAVDDCLDIPHKKEGYSTPGHNTSEPYSPGKQNDNMGHTGISTLSNVVCINGNEDHVDESNTAPNDVDDEDSHPCLVCGEKFALIKDLEAHARSHVRTKRHRGDSGVKYYGSEESKKERFTCDSCDKSFPYSSHLEKHQLVHTRQKLYSCHLCDKSYAYKSSAKVHMLIHTGDRPHECSICKKTFMTSSTLKSHILTHTDVRNFDCHLCTMKFRSRGALNRHLSTHSDDRPYKCTFCVKAFSTRDSINQHLKTHSSDRKFGCGDCEKTFFRNADLKKHVLTHTGERPYKCTDCGKAFFEKGYLNYHRRIHTGSKPFKCTICGKAFTQKSHVSLHMSSHSSEKLFRCEQCNKGFTLKSALTKHLTTHNGEKPYSCDQCGKWFSRKEYIVQHSRVHSGERPYDCGDCGRTFAFKSTLDEHKKSHSSGKIQFYCDLCGAGYSAKRYIKTHFLVSHS